MKTVDQLERELAEAKERVRLTTVQCTSCSGKGGYLDTTYDRTGEHVTCGRCYGSGLPEKRVNQIIAEAFAPFRKEGRP